MTRYSPDHKRESREKIVRAAGRLFRRHGYEGTGIDAVMAAAGLTRGGFYGHFRSKAALYRAVVADEHDFIERLRARESDADLPAAAAAIAADYLAPAHRTQVMRGCSIAALAVDTGRADRPARAAYAAAVRELAAELGRGMAGANDDPRDPDPRALQTIALCVGGLLVANACGADKALADAIAAAAQALCGERLTADS